MTPRPILTAEAMRAADQRAKDSGSSVTELMERAGTGLAEAAFRFVGPMPTLILCGPGNNGGDGYVAARVLAERGVAVRVAAVSEPKTEPAIAARSRWGGQIEPLGPKTAAAPLLIDALFGTGLKRGLDDTVSEQLGRLCHDAVARVACDLPSGIATDSGDELSAVPAFDLTVALGALKPAHRLSPAIHKMGRVAVVGLGLDAASQWHEIAAPRLPALRPDGHKYTRGLVHALAGMMPGAIALAATAAARAGAGYVRVSTSRAIEGLPCSVVQVGDGKVNDPRIGCLLVGPGLGDLPQVLTLALTSRAP
jgi:hydroxyethylthiazole kinase-like uncharacterized protein yjeF